MIATNKAHFRGGIHTLGRAMHRRSFLSIIVLACLAMASPVSGAEITVHSSGDFKLIAIEGKIVAGDEEKFRKIALGVEKAIVVLSSDGGALIPALDIGKTIQIRGYSTYVPAQFSCVSSCALIWTAGSKRLLSRSAQVGFHASYRDNDGDLEEVGMANAIVGRYLTLLNLPEEAVIFATAASPTEVSWIDTEDNQSGISFEIFDVTPDRSEAVSPPPIQTTPVRVDPVAASRQAIPSWYYATESGDGSRYYVRGSDVEHTRKTSRSAIFWMKTDDSKNRTIERRGSMQKYTLDCVGETYRMGDFIIYDAAGNPQTIGGTSPVQSVVPDSVFSDVVKLVCSDDRPAPDSRDLP